MNIQLADNTKKARVINTPTDQIKVRNGAQFFAYATI